MEITGSWDRFPLMRSHFPMGSAAQMPRAAPGKGKGQGTLSQCCSHTAMAGTGLKNWQEATVIKMGKSDCPALDGDPALQAKGRLL